MEAVSEGNKAIIRLVVLNNKKNSIYKISGHVKEPEVAISQIIEKEIVNQLQS